MDEFIKKINDGIDKTGFVLEYKICKILEKHNWTIINNRYYIDDVNNIEREIDIVAYKTSSNEDIHFYTCLLISCKKSEDNVWTFLTKNLDKNNPNINILPINNWTNVKTLKYVLSKLTPKDCNKIITKNKDIDFLYSLDKQVFAFQEINRTTGKPQNDKNIYNSIVTIIKASEYEKKSLNARKKIKAFYNFNLISVVDCEMFEIFFKDDVTEIKNIDNIRYLNRHIINNNEEFYRVHFINFNNFENILLKYNVLVDWNFAFYFDLFKSYYVDVFNNIEAVSIYWNDFNKEILWATNYIFKTVYKALMGEDINTEIKNIDYEYDNDEKLLNLIPVFKSSQYDILNDDLKIKLNKNKFLNDYIRKQLIKWYRYNGNFQFSEYKIPF